MTSRLHPLASLFTVVACLGGIACGDDASAPPAAPAGGSGGAAGGAGKGGSAATGGTAGVGGTAGNKAGGAAGASGAAGKGGNTGGTAGTAGAAGNAGAAGVAGAAGTSAGQGGGGQAGSQQGGAAGTAQGGSAQGGQAGTAQGGNQQGGQAGTGQGGSDAGGQGGTAQAGQAGSAQGGSDQGGQGGSDQGGAGGVDQGGASGSSGAGAGGGSGAGGAIVVGDFTVSVAPPSVNVVQGQTVGVDVTITPVNGFAGEVTLSFEGLPTGLTAPAVPVTIPAGSTTARVDFVAAADATVTSAEITVHAKAAGGLDRTATFTAAVQAAPDFGISIDQPAVTVTQGADASVTITIAKVGGFDGEVTLSFEGLPAGLTLPPGPIVIPAGATQTSVTLAADASADLGTSQITVKATAGALVRQTTFDATVKIPAAVITDACPVNGADVCLPYTDFRQGYVGLRVKFTATNVTLPGTTVTLDGTPGVILAKGGNEYIATFDLPHAGTLGTKDLTITNSTGPGIKAAVIEITPIAVASTAVAPGVAGNDATGRGTPLSPFRTIKRANELSAAGDTITVLTYSATTSEAFPIVLKPGTIFRGVPSATNVPPAIAASAGNTCAVETSGSAQISTLRFSACEITKKGAGLLALTDVTAYTAGPRGVRIDEGEASFACSGNLTAAYCRIESKVTAIVVAPGATVSGAPQIVGGTGTSDVGIDVAGTADLKGASFSSTVELALGVTGTATLLDTTVSAGPAAAADTNAAIVVSGAGKLTATNLGFTAVRRRGLLLKDTASAELTSGTWTGVSANSEVGRYFVRLEGGSTLKTTNVTATASSNGTDIFQLAGTGPVALSGGLLQGADTGARGVVGLAGSTSAVTITGTTLALLRGGSITAADGFAGTIAVGTGTKFETLNGSATNNPGALVDNRAAAGTVITVAQGVAFGGLTLGQGGDKTKDSPKIFFGSPAIPIWTITGAGTITFQ